MGFRPRYVPGMISFLISLVPALPLAVFLSFLDAGAGGVDWRMAYTAAGAAALPALLLGAVRRGADPLWVGTNLWLASGAACYLLEFWTPLGWYMRLGAGSLFAWVVLAAAVGLVAGLGERRGMTVTLAGALAALVWAVIIGGGAFWAGTVPFVLLLAGRWFIARRWQQGA